MPAARFHTYSDTHELELHGRSWRCRWCHQAGKQLVEACTGERPQPKPAFKFRTLTKKGVKKAKGRKIWGRKKAPRRAGVQHRRPGGHDAVKASLQEVWPRFPPPQNPPNKPHCAEPNTGAAAVQGEHIAHQFGRPPEG